MAAIVGNGAEVIPEGPTRVILHGNVTYQSVNRADRDSFIKEVVVTKGPVPLAMVRKRACAGGGASRAPVLLVHGFGQNRYAWHLPTRSFANHLARAGFDVYNIDLRGHGRSRQLGSGRCRSVLDYVREDLPRAIEEVQAQSDGRPVFVVGHSLGGLLTYAAAPALGGALAGIATLGSPYDFTRGSLSFACVSLAVRALSWALVPLGNLALPVGAVGMVMSQLRTFAETPLYPLPWRGWHKGALEHDVLQEHLRLAFDDAGLLEITDMFGGNRHQDISSPFHTFEQFEKLDVPILVIAGHHDDLAAPEGVRAAYVRSRSRDKTYRALPLGHIDLLVGRDAPLTTWPLVERWMIRRTKVDRADAAGDVCAALADTAAA